jgi:hypothetical protein
VDAVVKLLLQQAMYFTQPDCANGQRKLGEVSGMMSPKPHLPAATHQNSPGHVILHHLFFLLLTLLCAGVGACS